MQIMINRAFSPARGILRGGPLKTASLIFAAGRGSRMKGFDGNKTLLPLIVGQSPFEGQVPILLHVLEKLPPGPKALVVHHRKEEVMAATRSMDLTYCEQPVLNGTGGAVLAARPFIDSTNQDHFIITMGDIPLVQEETYRHLVGGLDTYHLVVLGFRPKDKKQYGVLEIHGNLVTKITEWKYWSAFSRQRQDELDICNSGIYAARKQDLIQVIKRLEKRPHRVLKERGHRMVEVEEYFITDMVELMNAEGLKVGCVLAENEDEVMGVDDLPSLQKAQALYAGREK